MKKAFGVGLAFMIHAAILSLLGIPWYWAFLTMPMMYLINRGVRGVQEDRQNASFQKLVEEVKEALIFQGYASEASDDDHLRRIVRSGKAQQVISGRAYYGQGQTEEQMRAPEPEQTPEEKEAYIRYHGVPYGQPCSQYELDRREAEKHLKRLGEEAFHQRMIETGRSYNSLMGQDESVPTKVWDEQQRCFVPENPDVYWKWYFGDRRGGA
jgi:hypothetical protein